jgi:Domain of unknown function (DUF4411)
MNIYSFDTCSLVDGINHHYRPAVFQSLWRKVDHLIAEGRIIASEEVRVEIERKDDRLLDWCNQRPSLFVLIDDQIQPVVSKVLSEHRKLLKESGTRSSADAFVIALAFIRNAIVVTEERASKSLDKPKIPDVCEAMGVPCMRFADMIEAEGWVM